MKAATIEREDRETEKRVQPKQLDNIKQLLLLLTSAITMEPVRDLSDLSKQRRDFYETSLMSRRVREVYERKKYMRKNSATLGQEKGQKK